MPRIKMKNIFKQKKSRAFTLIEIVIAMMIFSIAYAGIANMLIQGFFVKKKGQAQVVAGELAMNQLKMMNALPQPLYIGFPTEDVQKWQGDTAAIYNKLQDLEGNYLLDDSRKLVDPSAQHYPFNSHVDEAEIQGANATAGVIYTRKTWRQIESVSPCLVHIWIEVTWTEEGEEAGEESLAKEFKVEAVLTRLNEFD